MVEIDQSKRQKDAVLSPIFAPFAAGELLGQCHRLKIEQRTLHHMDIELATTLAESSHAFVFLPELDGELEASSYC